MREIVGQQWRRHLTPGSNPIPRTTMVSLEEGFASALAFTFSEGVVFVEAKDVLKPCVSPSAGIVFCSGHARYHRDGGIGSVF